MTGQSLGELAVDEPGAAGTAARRVSIGLELPTAEHRGGYDTPRWSDVIATAQLAEEIGIDTVWVEDHLLVDAPDSGRHGVWDCWSILAALAAATTRVEIGSFVACAGFRNPALLAKMADTIDEISGGRFVLGLGAGWRESEFHAFGFPFDRRVSRFEEAMAIIHPLLRSGHVNFNGAFHSVTECELRPRGPRPAGPPIMIGSTGERMLRLTARYADLWNGAAPSARAIPLLRERIDAACRMEGRDPASLARSVAVLVDFTGGKGVPRNLNPARFPPLSGSADEIAGELRAIVAEGISHIQLTTFPMTLDGLRSLGPVLERLR